MAWYVDIQSEKDMKEKGFNNNKHYFCESGAYSFFKYMIENSTPLAEEDYLDLDYELYEDKEDWLYVITKENVENFILKSFENVSKLTLDNFKENLELFNSLEGVHRLLEKMKDFDFENDRLIMTNG